MLHVHVSNDPLQSYRKYITNPTRTEPFRAIYITMPEGHSILFLPFDIEPGELSHECMHVVQHIIKTIGASYTEDEFVCYLLGYLVEKVTKFVNKSQKGLDKPLQVLYNGIIDG